MSTHTSTNNNDYWMGEQQLRGMADDAGWSLDDMVWQIDLTDFVSVPQLGKLCGLHVTNMHKWIDRFRTELPKPFIELMGIGRGRPQAYYTKSDAEYIVKAHTMYRDDGNGKRGPATGHKTRVIAVRSAPSGSALT